MTDLVRIPFHGAEILAVDTDGKPHIFLRPIIDGLGIDYSTQVRKLKAKSWACVGTRPTQLPGDTQAREHVTVDVRTFLMLLATIDENRVAENARAMLVAYQNEVADVIESYWTRGAALNPRATADQLDDVIEQAQKQARLLQTVSGLVDAKWLEANARELVSRALGKELELPTELMPLYVPDFLKDKGLDASEINSVQSWFGRRVVEMGQANGLTLPELRPRQLPNGTMRETRAWTREHLPLFEEVWDTYYAEQYARPMFLTA